MTKQLLKEQLLRQASQEKSLQKALGTSEVETTKHQAPKVLLEKIEKPLFWFEDEEKYPMIEEITLEAKRLEESKDFNNYNEMFSKFNHTGLMMVRVKHEHFNGEFPVTFNNAEGTLSVWAQQRFYEINDGEVRSKSSFEPTAIIKANVLREAVKYLEF